MKRTFSILLFLAVCLSLTITAGANADLRNQLFILINENYNPAQYTAESYEVYHDALTEALLIHNSKKETEDQLQETVNTLRSAIDGLVPSANPRVLNLYIDMIDSYIYSIRYKYSDELMNQMVTTRNELKALIDRNLLTEDTFNAATRAYEQIISRIRNEAVEIEGFSGNSEDETLLFPKEMQREEENAGQVTMLRIYLVAIALVLIPIGLTIFIIYLVTGRKKENAN